MHRVGLGQVLKKMKIYNDRNRKIKERIVTVHRERNIIN